MQDSQTNPKLITRVWGQGPRLLAVACVLMGLLVMAGWYLRSPALVQVLPGFAPMQYNTALGFVLAGLGLLSVFYDRRRFSVVMGVAVSILGLLTLCQYISKIDLGIDELFMEHFVADRTSHVGRMSPNTALCFSIAGFMILLFVRNMAQGFNFTLARDAATVLFGLGLVTMLGYVAGHEKIYGWATYSRMAIHTAAGFITLGAAGIWHSQLTSEKSGRVALGFPWTGAVVVTIFVLTIGIWHAIDSRDRRLIQEVIQGDQVYLSNTITEKVEQNTTILRRMAQRWQSRGGTPEAEWRDDARNYIEDMPGLLVLKWIASGDGRRWTESSAGVDTQALWRLASSPLWQQSWNQARKTGLVLMSPPVGDGSSTIGFFMFVPVYLQDDFQGAIVGFYGLEAFVQGLTPGPILNRYDLQLGFQEQVFFNTDPDETGSVQDHWDVSGEIQLPGVVWQLLLRPKGSFLSQEKSALTDFTLAGSVLATIFISVLIYGLLGLRRLSDNLAESRKQLGLILDNAGEGIYGLDMNGYTVFANRAAETLVGYRAAEMLHRSQHDLIHHHHADGRAYPREECNIYKAMSSGQTTSDEGEVFWRKDGSYFYVEYTSTAIRDSRGQVTGAVVVFRDITERRAAEQELQQVNRELENFAYVASHDLKAPLRVIDNASKWLEEDLEPHLDEDSRGHLDLLRRRVRRMEKLLDDLLDYARIGRKEDHRYKEATTGGAILEDVLLLLAPPEGFNVTHSAAFDAIRTTQMPFQQVLTNLINNAIKHHDRDSGHIALDAKEEAMGYVITVTDDGPGIEPQYHEKVFGIFQTLKPRDQVEGSGMGLAIIQKIVETYGGRVEVKSEGRGTAFILNWPKQMLS